MSRIEAGRRRLSADELQRFAEALHVSADELLQGGAEPPPPAARAAAASPDIFHLAGEPTTYAIGDGVLAGADRAGPDLPFPDESLSFDPVTGHEGDDLHPPGLDRTSGPRRSPSCRR